MESKSTSEPSAYQEIHRVYRLDVGPYDNIVSTLLFERIGDLRTINTIHSIKALVRTGLLYGYKVTVNGATIERLTNADFEA